MILFIVSFLGTTTASIAQVTPERQHCITLHNSARSHINQVVGQMVSLRNKGVIDYDYFIYWQNRILNESEYTLFELYRNSYDGIDEVCNMYYYGTMNTVNRIVDEFVVNLKQLKQLTN